MVTKFFIPGPPFGKARPRRGKYSTYDPSCNKEYEAKVKAAYLEARGMVDPSNTPIILMVKAFYPIPETAKRKRKPDKIIEGDICMMKPDVDNILKSVMDGLNNVAYFDDRQVYDVRCTRTYSDNPGIEVTLITVGGNDDVL